jgi:hypothetical protein
MKSHHEGREDGCGHMEHNKTELNSHTKIRHERKQIGCNQCSIEIKTGENVNDHIRNTHEARIFNCNEWSDKSGTNDQTGVPVTKHTPERRNS